MMELSPCEGDMMMSLRLLLMGSMTAALIAAPAPVASSALTAATTDPVIVKLIGDGQLQASSPDDGSYVYVRRNPPTSAYVDVQSDHPVVATAPCFVDTLGAHCPVDVVKSVVVLTFAGDDVVYTEVPVPVTVSSGAGNDSVETRSPLSNIFLLGDGDDSIALEGVGSNDVFGGLGRDVLSYGPDAPTLSGVTVTLDDVANDGAAGQTDNARSDIEDIYGSPGNDILVGSGGNNRISGWLGNDTIRGLGGNDLMDGDAGNDLMDGGAGIDTVDYGDHTQPVAASLDSVANDGQTGEVDSILNTENLFGGSANDTLIGNAGPNFIDGAAGNDRILGQDGNDKLSGNVGFDSVDGGTGTDQCVAEVVIRCP
jgi:Ca2+-binding RTX toxin-like protein